ncbi:MAG: TonB-dependent receptor, partial [Gammaproteobacteria bacterium]
LAMEQTLVTPTRVARDPLTTPLAISVVDADDIQRRQMLGLDEAMGRVPGMFFTNRYNFSRDLRISIRGFGARSNFGVRGLRVYVDGIPYTTPDGQTALDDLDLSNVERVEVIRGPASALYGSSAGGVINIFTQDGPATPFAEAGVLRGSYDFGRYQFKTGGQSGALNYFVNGSYLNYGGYRDHTDTEQGIVNGKFGYTFADGSTGQLIVRAAHAPEGEDPGGLNAAERAADRRAARDRNVAFDAGEEVDELKVAWSWHKAWDVHELTLRNYYNWRDFDARLPLPPFLGAGTVAFDRFYFGGGAQYSNASALFAHANRVTLGIDADHITDDRRRWDNLSGGVRGPLRFDQDEQADTVGIYLQDEFSLTEQVELQAGLRYDHVELAVDDNFIAADGDQSETLEFNEINWMVGAVWSPLEPLNLYANYATAFETPTFTEFAQLSGTGGFANVIAQRTRGFEVGLKGLVMQRLRYDLAYYDMTVEDEVVTVDNIGGRGFFRNADTDRQGVEVAMNAELLRGLEASVAYTYTDLEFDRFPTNPAAEGARLPGVPEHFGYFELDYHHATGLFVKWDWSFVGALYADNVNQTRVDSYDVSNLVFGLDHRIGRFTISPTIGINNLFDANYNTDIRIEDTTNRFFEPAPERNVFGGVRLRYEFDV